MDSEVVVQHSDIKSSLSKDALQHSHVHDNVRDFVPVFLNAMPQAIRYPTRFTDGETNASSSNAHSKLKVLPLSFIVPVTEASGQFFSLVSITLGSHRPMYPLNEGLYSSSSSMDSATGLYLFMIVSHTQ